jgi:hypothetical protein
MAATLPDGVSGTAATLGPTPRCARRRRAWPFESRTMKPEDLDAFENDLELSLYREYRDVVRMFAYVVETERRFYLCNEVEVIPHEGSGLMFELHLTDAWVWDMFRTARFIKHVRVLTFRDVNIEELAHDEPGVPTFLED